MERSLFYMGRPNLPDRVGPFADLQSAARCGFAMIVSLAAEVCSERVRSTGTPKAQVSARKRSGNRTADLGRYVQQASQAGSGEWCPLQFQGHPPKGSGAKTSV
jgi:hypothetical protein